MRILCLLILVIMQISPAFAFPQTVFPKITAAGATQNQLQIFIKKEYIEQLELRKQVKAQYDLKNEKDVMDLVRFITETSNRAINRAIDYFPQDHYAQVEAYKAVKELCQTDLGAATKGIGGEIEAWGYTFNPEIESYIIGEFKTLWDIKGDPRKPYFEAIKKHLSLSTLKIFFPIFDAREIFPRNDHPISNFISLNKATKFMVYFTNEPNYGLGGYTIGTNIYINVGKLKKTTHFFDSNIEETIQMVISNEITHAMINHVFGDDQINDTISPDKNLFHAKKLNGYAIHDNREAIEFISDAISIAVNPKFLILPLSSGEDGYRLSRQFAREELTKYCLANDIAPPVYAKLDNAMKLREYLQPKLSAKGISYAVFLRDFQSKYTLMAGNIFAEFGFNLQPII